jgi:hypothetical protein
VQWDREIEHCYQHVILDLRAMRYLGKTGLLVLLAICLPFSIWSQAETPMPKAYTPPPPAPVQDGPQFGVRFGYQLQFPSKNYVLAQNYSFFEAGHHLGYGGFVNLKADEGIQFCPYLGLEHVFWPKSAGYTNACDLDSFPTFMAVNDSLPGRDFRFYNIVFEPALKFYLRRMSVFLKLQPIFSYNIKRKVEQYSNTCGVDPAGGFVDYTSSSLRGMSKFTFSVGAGIVKEVHLPGGSGIALEPGVKLMLSRLLHVSDTDPNGLDFTLYPWGVYLNLSFFR